MNEKNKKTSTGDDVYTRFSDLIASDIPQEYKQLLENFHKQGNFYSQLVQSVSKNNDLSSFWDLPSTLGFDKAADNSDDWFSSLFNINGYAEHSKQQLEGNFNTQLEKFSETTQSEMKRFQAALAEMSELHVKISETALAEFNRLTSADNQPTNEQLSEHWLKAGEMAFNKISTQEPYIETQHQLFGSLGKLQTTQQEFASHFSTMLGLPSIEDLDELKQALHQIRLEFAEYREQTDAQLDALTKKVPKAP